MNSPSKACSKTWNGLFCYRGLKRFDQKIERTGETESAPISGRFYASAHRRRKDGGGRKMRLPRGKIIQVFVKNVKMLSLSPIYIKFDVDSKWNLA